MVSFLKLLAPHHGSMCWDLPLCQEPLPWRNDGIGCPRRVKEKNQNKGKKKQLVPLVRLRSRHSSLSSLGLDAMLEGLPKVTRLRGGGGVVLF